MENYYDQFSDEELKQLIDDCKIIENNLDYKTILRILKIRPDYKEGHVYEILNGILTTNKRLIFCLDSMNLEEFKQNSAYYFSHIYGQHFAGLNVTENDHLNLYFTNGLKTTMIQINFNSGEISLNLVFPIFSLDDVPEEITHQR